MIFLGQELFLEGLYYVWTLGWEDKAAMPLKACGESFCVRKKKHDISKALELK